MTVEELIDALTQLDPASEVVIGEHTMAVQQLREIASVQPYGDLVYLEVLA